MEEKRPNTVKSVGTAAVIVSQSRVAGRSDRTPTHVSWVGTRPDVSTATRVE